MLGVQENAQAQLFQLLCQHDGHPPQGHRRWRSIPDAPRFGFSKVGVLAVGPQPDDRQIQDPPLCGPGHPPCGSKMTALGGGGGLRRILTARYFYGAFAEHGLGFPHSKKSPYKEKTPWW